MKYFSGLAAAAALLLATASANAQWVTSYYAPAYAAPVPVRAYYAPAAYPVRAAYYAPTTAYYAAPVATTAYYAPTTAYYAPTAAYYAPTTAYYAPAAVTTPVVVGRPVGAFYSGYGGAEIRVPGRPIANTLRTIIP